MKPANLINYTNIHVLKLPPVLLLLLLQYRLELGHIPLVIMLDIIIPWNTWKKKKKNKK